MVVWFALIIPFLGIAIATYLFRSRIVWWELIAPISICIILILLSNAIADKAMTSDTEYISDIGVRARYYEYYETYVHRTCTRSCGKNCTTTYDCSYCDKNPPHWELIDSKGETYSISKTQYEELKKRWKSTPKFIELGRHINKWGGCGEDGDAYEIYWDGNPINAETVTNTHMYENRLQAAHTSFDFIDVTESDVKTYGLYEYPDINGYHMDAVIGEDSVAWMKPKTKLDLERYLGYVSGRYTPKTKGRAFILFYVDKPSLSGNFQEAYWGGGNENEVVICVGVDSKKDTIHWVDVFSWSDDKKITVDIREDIIKVGKVDQNQIFIICDKHMKNFKYKDFNEFSYVHVDPPTGYIVFVYIMTLLVTIGVCYWAVHNEFHHEERRYSWDYNPLKSKEWDNISNMIGLGKFGKNNKKKKR